MRRQFRTFGVLVALAFSIAAFAAQDPVTLKRLAKVGDVTRYRLTATLDFAGTPAVFSGLINEKVTQVDDAGRYTVQSTATQASVTLGGTKAPDPPDEVTTSTFNADGSIVSIVSDSTDPNVYRMANLEALIFPKDPVKMGGSWDITINKDAKGSVDAKGTYKLEGQEKIGDWDCYRIHGTMKESTGEAPASLDAYYWISVKDGTIVKLTGTWKNAPFPGSPAPADAKIDLMREG